MARVTVEDCLENVANRFDLVMVASKRARQLENGSEPTLPWDNDKPTVLALREVAQGTISEEILAKQAADKAAADLASDEELQAQFRSQADDENAGV